jgi:chromosome segregation ATPase
MTDEQIQPENVNEEEDVASVPSTSEGNGNPETSPALNAARRTKKGLSSFLDKAEGRHSFTDTTEHTCETAATVETEIWNTAQKIIEDQLEKERAENRRNLDRVIQRFKGKRDRLKAELRKVQQEKSHLAKENDVLQKALGEEKKNGEKTLAVHHRALDRNDRMQTSADRLRQHIEKLEQERFVWVEERSKLMCTLSDMQAQVQRLKKTKKPYPVSSLHSLDSIPEDKPTKQSDQNIANSTLRHEQTKNREAILSSQLEEVTKKFEFQGKLLKMKNNELSDLEASKKILSDDLASMSKKLESHENVVADLRQNVQTAKDSVKPISEENAHLRRNVSRLQELIGSFSEQVASQQSFVKNIKDHVHEGKVLQVKHADALLKACREFEGSCKKYTQMQASASKPRRRGSKSYNGEQQSFDSKRSSGNLVESVINKPLIQDNCSNSIAKVVVECQVSGTTS